MQIQKKRDFFRSLSRVISPSCYSDALNVLSAVHAERVASRAAHTVHENALLRSGRPRLVLDFTPFVLNSGRLTLGQVVDVETANHVLVFSGDQDGRSGVGLSVGVTEINLLHKYLLVSVVGSLAHTML